MTYRYSRRIAETGAGEKIMNIIIKETGEKHTFEIIDPNNGVDWIKDFIGNTGARDDGQFVFDDDKDVWLCDQQTFDWWDDVIGQYQEMDNRIYTLKKEHDADQVDTIVADNGGYDFGDIPGHVMAALDEAFGVCDED